MPVFSGNVLIQFSIIFTAGWTSNRIVVAARMPLLRVEDTRAFRLEVHVDESRVTQVLPGAQVS